MLWALMGGALVGLVGLTVDFTRAQAIRAEIQNAVDGAVLVAERSANLTLAEREAAAQAYFDAEVGDLADDVTLTLIALDTGGHRIEASMPMPTTLARLVDNDDWSIHVAAEAQAQASPPIEVVLALDNTGSMSGDIDTLKDGAADLVDFLLQLDGDTVSVGLVPFNAQVNIGASNTQWVDTTDTNPLNGLMLEGRYLGYRNTTGGACTGAAYPTTYGGMDVRWIPGQTSNPGTSWDNTGRCYAFSPEQVNVWSLYQNLPSGAAWRGCVEERPEPYDLNDAAPDPNVPGTMFVPYFALDDGGNVSSPRNNWVTSSSYDTSNPLQLSGSPSWQTAPSSFGVRTLSVFKYRPGVSVTLGSGVTGRGPNRGCPLQPIVALTSDEDELNDAIDAMVADGYTNQLHGLAWAWRVISPGAPFTQGRPYDDPNDPVRKVIVLFTDGANTVENGNNSVLGSEYNGHGYRMMWSSYQTTQVPHGSGAAVTWSEALDSAYQRTGINNNNDMVDYFNDRQLEMCTAIKAQNVEIYTIGFRITNGSTEDALLENCATDAEHNFLADNQEELLEAFDAIGTGIGQLRLTQ
jgi:hypothetical protein